MTDTSKTVEEYITSFPESTRIVLEEIRNYIQKQVPEATETMSYGMPTFILKGSYLIYYAGYKNHIGIYPAPVNEPGFKDDFLPYKTGRGSIQFPLNKPMPYPLIGKILKHNLQQNSKRAAEKSKAK